MDCTSDCACASPTKTGKKGRESIRSIAEQIYFHIIESDIAVTTKDIANVVQCRRRRVFEVLNVFEVLQWIQKDKKKYSKTCNWGQTFFYDRNVSRPYKRDVLRIVTQASVVPRERNDYTICNILCAIGVYTKTKKNLYVRSGEAVRTLTDVTFLSEDPLEPLFTL